MAVATDPVPPDEDERPGERSSEGMSIR